MPIQGWGHVQYWEFSDTTVAPVIQAAGAGYPAWQASVIAPSLFGALHEWLVLWWQRLVWYIRTGRRLSKLGAADARLLDRLLGSIEGAAFPAAQRAVKETARTIHFNRPESWIPYNRMIKENRSRAENLFRHVRACELTRTYYGSTLTNPEVNLVVELAYQDYALRGR